MQNRKPIFFSSDWHIGHDAVIRYSKRPFKDVDHMSKVLINNYNACVPENGICYFLGDMGLCKAEILKEVIDQLNGTKVLILGNHDAGVNAMYRMGFDVVLYSARMQISGHPVTLSHCPMLGKFREHTEGMRGSQAGENWHGESREKFRKFTVEEHEGYHLHAHIHSPNNGKSKRIEGKQFDVGVDANDYRPVSISKIESWIAKDSKCS